MPATKNKKSPLTGLFKKIRDVIVIKQ